MTITILGSLLDRPVESTYCYGYPDTWTGGMVCGSPDLWLRWGGGPWRRYDRPHRGISVSEIREWLTLSWSAGEAVDLWSRLVQGPKTTRQYEIEAGTYRVATVDYDAIMVRVLAARIEDAQDYARAIGVTP